jgi:hypothetical protein
LSKSFFCFSASLVLHLSILTPKYAHHRGMKVSANGNLKGLEEPVDIQEYPYCRSETEGLW